MSKLSRSFFFFLSPRWGRVTFFFFKIEKKFSLNFISRFFVVENAETYGEVRFWVVFYHQRRKLICKLWGSISRLENRRQRDECPSVENNFSRQGIYTHASSDAALPWISWVILSTYFWTWNPFVPRFILLLLRRPYQFLP